MRPPAVALLLAAWLPGVAESAFEPVPQAPWMTAGASSSLFPSCAATLFENPASTGLLEGWSVSASASRPFGLERLDRASLAGALPWRQWCFAAGLLASGDSDYSEWTISGGCSRRLATGLAGGLSISSHRLSIEGYGSCTGFSSDIGLVARPMDGVLTGATVHGLLRSRLGNAPDPVVPRSFSLAAGVAPVASLRLAGSVSFTEGLDPEPSFTIGYAPSRSLVLGLGLQSDPARFAFSVSLGAGPVEFLYGLGFHPSLGETHSAGVAIGRAGHVPVPAMSHEEPEMPADPHALVGINTAGLEELESLPGIGPARAEAIVAYRSENGPFTSIDQLLDVPGIGPSLLDSIRARLVVD